MQKFKLCIKDQAQQLSVVGKSDGLTLSLLDLTRLILTQNICFNAFLCVLGNKGAFVSIAHTHKTNFSASNCHI